MITRERLEEILDGESRGSLYTKGIDAQVVAIALLRERIPHEVCGAIIGAAEHDQIYLCDIDDVLPYINEEDARTLAGCRLFIDSENDCFSMWA